MIPMSSAKMAANIILPWVHRIFSNLKVWALGVYHGLRRKHLLCLPIMPSERSIDGDRRAK
jgi:hypothetical protein